MKSTLGMKRRLFDALCDFHKERDFVLGVTSNVTCDEDRQIVIDFIKQKNKPTLEEVSLLSVELDQRRHPEDYIWED